MNKIEILPDDINEAIELLKMFYDKKTLEEISKITEEELIVSSHFFSGTFIRNSWFLWWHEDHGYEAWPKEKPKLVEQFNSLGVYHADDISSMLMTCLFRNIKDIDLDLNGQVEHYKKYWKKLGYKNGNPFDKPIKD